MTVMITMAGFGSRFQRAGYKSPKFAVEVKGRTLFEWSMSSLQSFAASDNYVFVVRKEDRATYFITTQCDKMGINKYRVVELDSPTNGQATTAYMGLKECEDSEPICIYNIDTYVEPSYVFPPDPSMDGYIPCFKAPGDHWSFVKLDSQGSVEEVREKERISDYATIGLYWFKSKHLFEEAYNAWYVGASRYEKGEAYIAPMYNYLCENGYRVGISEIPFERVHPLGTPEEIELFKSKD